MGVELGVRSIVATSCRKAEFRSRIVMGAIIAGLALGFAAHANAACSSADCSSLATATNAATEAGATAGRPVKLNAFSKRTGKQAAVATKRKVAKHGAIAARTFATKRAAKYSRIATRVQKAAQKFKVAADASAPAQPSQPRIPSSVSPFAGDSLKPLVADARAEMTDADLTAAGASPPAPVAVADASAQIAGPLMQVVSADQVNDIDRAAATAEAPATRPGQVLKPISPQRATLASTDSAWDQTSLIGKLFVAFGGILTLASAARMFIA